MKKSEVRLTLIIILFAMVLVSCATNPKSRHVQIDYGTVELKELVKGDIKETTLVGGYMGMQAIPAGPEVAGTNRSKEINIGSASENLPSKYRYAIKKRNGATINIVTGKDFFTRKDCVAIEKGYSYNLRLVDDDMCQTLKVDESDLKRQKKPANDCIVAKRQMIIAQSDKEFISSRELVDNSCQFSRNQASN